MKIRSLTLIVSSISILWATSISASSTWQVSQTDFGGVGLLQTPTGRMADEGEFNVGVSFNDDYQHYNVSLQLTNWLETTIRYTRLPDLYFSDNDDYSGDNLYTDKGIDLKLRLFQESYWLPETSVGLRDLGGTGLFDGEYVATTKRFGNIDLTLGLGWGYLGQSGIITNPLCRVSDKFCERSTGFKGTGGSVDFERWFKGPASFFGGIEYQTPYDPLRLKIEYDGNDYSKDFPAIRGGKSMKQHTAWNVGINYRVSNWGDAKISYQRGDTLTLGFNLYTNFNQIKSTWRDDEKPQALLRPSKTENNWHKVANQLENNAGYRRNTIEKDGSTLVALGEQAKYRDRNEALDRAAAILSNNSDSSIDKLVIIEQKDGLKLTETHINREQYLAAANKMQIDSSVESSFETKEISALESSNVTLASNKKSFGYGIDPVLKQTIGAPESFYLYSIGFNTKSNYWLTDNIEATASVYFNLIDNYDKFNYVKNSPHVRNYATPRVRTMFRAYVDQPVRLNRLQLTWFEQPTEAIFTQIYAGYLESMFAGVGAEALYRPYGKNWAVGIDANLVSQRDPDSWFGVYKDDYFFYNEESCNSPIPQCQAYVLSKGTTGHVTAYYMPRWKLLENTLFKISAGKFLGGDIGARIDFSKQFKSGVIVGAYATLTDLTEEEYGEGSYNKGFYISIPFDLITVKPSTNRAKISWQPITRDGGQMLSRKYHLFDQTDARYQWTQRPSSVN